MSPERNSRATALLGSLLLVMFAIEGLTLISLQSLISVHVFIGGALITPVVAKLATTGYRFARYYRKDRDYVTAGPPKPVLRALGPLVIAATITLLASGVGLITIGTSSPLIRQVHQASAIVWLVLTGVHVLGHLIELPGLLRARRVAAHTDVPGSAPRARARPAIAVAAIALLSVGGGALALPAAHRFHGRDEGSRAHVPALHQTAADATGVDSSPWR